MYTGMNSRKRRRLAATYDHDDYDAAERQIQVDNERMSDEDYVDFEQYPLRAEDAVRAGIARQGRYLRSRPKRRPNPLSLSGREALQTEPRPNVIVKTESNPVNQMTETPHHTAARSQTPITPSSRVSNSQMSARDFAQKWQHLYAGELTEFLEKRYHEWKGRFMTLGVLVRHLTSSTASRGSAKVHDSACLVCYSDENRVDLQKCNTCSRVYHKDCLNIPTGQELERLWYCPLCQKRLWDKITPTKTNQAPTVVDLENRRMALCRKFTTNANFSHWIEFNDDGSVESDHVLIMAIGKANYAKYLDLDGTFGEPLEDPIYNPVITGTRYHDQESPTPRPRQDQQAAFNLDDWLTPEATRPSDCDG